ncbi:MAG: RNA polymerase subunit sigma-24 [Verrucomicrobia bacterium]|nr:MAG: RNA polymerase subunit sigma-24 [Verrucomicrobiota bacterium]
MRRKLNPKNNDDATAGIGYNPAMSSTSQSDAGQLRPDQAFHTTHWSVVLAARDPQGTTVGRDALARLCSAYWYPLYGYVRGRGVSQHDAEDLTQEFFCRFLEGNSLVNVSPAKGKFRSFLLACLKHFLVNEWERAHAQRRGGGQTPVPLDSGEGETRMSLEPADQLTPEGLFERRWAFAVLEQTMKALQGEYAAKNKSELFDDLKGFLPGGQGTESRADLAAKRGISTGAVDVAVHRLRQRFGTLLREQVAQTVSSEGEVDEEIRDLMTVLGS